jgi:hypothetical protein
MQSTESFDALTVIQNTSAVLELPNVAPPAHERARVIGEIAKIDHDHYLGTRLLDASEVNDIGTEELKAKQASIFEIWQQTDHPEIFNPGTRFHIVDTFILGQAISCLWNLHEGQPSINENLQGVIDLSHDNGRMGVSHLVLGNDLAGNKIDEEAGLSPMITGLMPNHDVFWNPEAISILQELWLWQSEKPDVYSEALRYELNEDSRLAGLVARWRELTLNRAEEFYDQANFERSPYWAINIVVDNLGKRNTTWDQVINVGQNREYANSLFMGDPKNRELKPFPHPIARLWTLSQIVPAVAHARLAGEYVANHVGFTIEEINTEVVKFIQESHPEFQQVAENLEWEKINSIVGELKDHLLQNFS